VIYLFQAEQIRNLIEALFMESDEVTVLLCNSCIFMITGYNYIFDIDIVKIVFQQQFLVNACGDIGSCRSLPVHIQNLRLHPKLTDNLSTRAEDIYKISTLADNWIESALCNMNIFDAFPILVANL